MTPNLTLTGELARLDIVDAGGYAVSVFAKQSLNWKSQLRFPLLQFFIAGDLGCPIHEVKAGVYVVEDGQHEFTVFTDAEIRAALAEVSKLAKVVGS